MSYIQDSLLKNEKTVEIFKHHWSSYIPVAFVAVFGLIILIGPLLALWVWLATIKCVEQGVTSKRVIRKTGIISRHSEEMKINRIETVEIRQGILGRIFGAGDVIVTGQGISSLTLKWVDSPMRVKKAIERVDE